MTFIHKLGAVAVLLGSTIATAQDYSSIAIEAFWKSHDVRNRIEILRDAGFTRLGGEPSAIVKHKFYGASGFSEHSYIVTQSFTPNLSAHYRATSISAIVVINARGEAVSTKIVNLPKATPNDFNGGSDEN